MIEYGLGVHAGLVVEGRVAGDGGVEGHRDPDHVRHHPVQLRKQVEPVLQHQLGLHTHEPGDHAAQRHDPIPLADAKQGGVDVCGSRLQGGKGVGDGTAGVVVGVELDVAFDVAAYERDQLEDLVRGGDADGVGQPHPLWVQPVDRAVDAQQVVRVRAEGVLAAETHLQALRLDESHHLGADRDDLLDRLAVREHAQGRGGPEKHIDTVDTG